MTDLSTPSEKRKLVQDAAEWHVLITSDDAEPEEIAAFKTWLEVEEHAKIYQRFERIWRQLEPASTIAAHSTIDQVINKPGSRFTKASLPVVLLAAASCLLLLKTDLPTLVTADYTAVKSHSQLIELPDQSTIILAPMSAVNIEYNADLRTIQLLKGQVSIDVAHDQKRPLRINTKHGSAQALGTQFTVEYLDTYSQVKVLESKVQVCSVQQNCQQLNTGEQSNITTFGVSEPEPLDEQFLVDPFNKQLIVDNQPVTRVLETLQSHHLGYIAIDKASLQGINVSGVFPLDDLPMALSSLEKAVPVKVNQYSRWLTKVGKQK